MWQILTKLGTKHPWVKGIQICFNERPSLFPREDKNKIQKNTMVKDLKSSKLNHIINFKLGTMNPYIGLIK